MALFTRLRNLVRSDRHSSELDREFDFHIRECADALIGEGMDPDAALVEARRRFGNRGAQKERARDVDLFPLLDSIRGDVRYAIRALAASPVFTAVTVASLALGIGANTAIFSLIDALLLRTLPVVAPQELLRVTLAPDPDGRRTTITNPMWEAFRDRQNVFSGVFAVGSLRSDLATTGVLRPVRGSWVSGEYFSTLGVRPAAGRLLGPADDVRGCPPILVLGHRFWQLEYGGDPGVMGRTLSLAGTGFRVVGVADERFFGTTVGETQAIYAPLCAMEYLRPGTLDHRRNWFLTVIGRPRAGVSDAQIETALATLSPGLMEATVATNIPAEERAEHLGLRLGVEPGAMGTSYLRQSYGKALYALAAIVAVVLLVACANVANLLLARGASRRREVAVRLALGASRARLTRQLVIESLVLALVGSLLGLGIAYWGGRVLVAMISASSPVFLDLAINARLLGFACAVAVLTALAFGVFPALRETAVDPQEAIKSGGRGLTAGTHRVRAGKTLVSMQLALALVVVICAGLLLASFRRLSTQDPGFRSDRILLVSTSFNSAELTPQQRREIQSRFRAAIREMPGVTAVAAMNATPIGGSYITDEIVRVMPSGVRRGGKAHFNDVGAGYFNTLQLPIIAGREFRDDDDARSPLVAVINQSAARKFFADGNPIGRTFHTKTGETTLSAPFTVVGIVGDAKYSSLRQEAPPTIYKSISQTQISSPNYAVRASGEPSGLASSVMAVAKAVDPRLRLGLTPLTDQVATSISREHLLAVLSTFFGGLAVLLATIGVYGIMAYAVSRRRNEFGIRIAVGATPTQVVALVTREMAFMVGAGVIAGGLMAMAATRLIGTFLYDISPLEPVVVAAAVVVLALAAAAASITPALRAARVDPVFALREE